MAFEVASVKQSPQAAPYSRDPQESNVSLNPQGGNEPTSGLLTARNWPLFAYIAFAYKLTPDQIHEVQVQLPKWATTQTFDIDGRAQGNPTRDQVRLMLQSLLMDRFHMKVHTEMRESPRYALLVDKPGKLGAGLKVHSDAAHCPTAASPPASASTRPCPRFTTPQSVDGQTHLIGYGVTMQQLANAVYSHDQIDRPIVDQTQLSGTFDFTLDWVPESAAGPSTNPSPDAPTLRQALRDELGLKLEQTTIALDTLVIDQIEQPTPN